MKRAKTQVKTKESQSLEVISNQEPKATQKASERRRLPRLNVTSEQFRLAANGKIFSVVDLSMSGMAMRILERNDLILFPVGALVEGTVNLQREKHKIQARVRHLVGDLVGLEFVDLEKSSLEALKKTLDPATLGAELKPIPSSENRALWYHGSSGTDLLLWRATDGEYRRFTLYVMGSYIQWDSETRVTTGHMAAADEQSEVRGVIRFETMLLEPDHPADPTKLKIAKTLLLSSNLPQDLKKWCVRQLEI